MHHTAIYFCFLISHHSFCLFSPAGKSKSVHLMSASAGGFRVTSSPEGPAVTTSTPAPQNIVFKVGGQTQFSPPPPLPTVPPPLPTAPPPLPSTAPPLQNAPQINIALNSAAQPMMTSPAASRPDAHPPAPPPKPSAAKTAAAAAAVAASAQSASDYEVDADVTHS